MRFSRAGTTLRLAALLDEVTACSSGKVQSGTVST